MSPQSRVLLTYFLVLTTIIIPGCWNRREIDTLGLVMASGIDEAEDGGIKLTVQVAKPFAIAGGESDSKASQEKPFWVVTSTGKTVFEAVRNLASQSPRRLYWAHNRFLIIGESMARRGITEILDLFARDAEPRLLAYIIVVKGATAWDLLQAEFELEKMPSEGGQGIIMNVEQSLSSIIEAKLNDFLRRLESEGIEPVGIQADIIPLRPDYAIGGDLQRKEVKARAKLGGTAVFKGGELVGWLDERETRGANWVLGKVRSGILVIKQPGQEDKLMSLEILRGSGNIKAEIKDGKVSIKIRVEAEANLGESQGTFDPIESPETWAVIESYMKEAVKGEILAALEKIRELNSDILGFGAAVFRKDPKYWREIEGCWYEVFPDLEITVEVNAKLRRTGLIMRSAREK